MVINVKNHEHNDQSSRRSTYPEVLEARFDWSSLKLKCNPPDHNLLYLSITGHFLLLLGACNGLMSSKLVLVNDRAHFYLSKVDQNSYNSNI